MKYVTKENFQQYDSSLKDYIDDVFTQDLSSYGVSWKPNVADPHLTRVGNMTYHKSLPIQNNIKGCIAQMKDGAKIIYYLNPTDWRFREAPTILYNKEVSTTITDDVFGDLKYDQQYVKINNIVCQVISINTSTKTATIKPESTLEAGTYDIELGSCTNGYDGEVMVEVPEFWIKSWDTDTRREVRITPTYIDDSWEHQPHILVSPYHDTVLNTVPTNMGYLSTLEVNSAVSICNIHDYCRGGSNDTILDQYITTDRFRSTLGKPRTLIDRATMRTNCRKSGKEILSYLQYKRIMYWLYIIEYANFNSQEKFTDTLTSEGFRQGGLDKGLTTIDWDDRILFNDLYPITPNGYTNDIGNGTGQKNINSYKFTANTSVSRFKVYEYDNNVITANKADNLFTVTSVKKASTKAIFVSATFVNGTYIYKIEGLQTGQSLTFKCDTYSNQIQTDGEYSIEWDINTNQQRQIVFNFIGNCNIKISLVKAGTTSKEITFYFKINRWHGIENPFGDTWTLLDGVLCSPTVINNANKVYMCKNPEYFSSNLNVKYQLIGTTLHHNGWGKQWKFTSEADLLTDSVGANSATYRCDVYYIEASNNYLRMLLVGNDASGTDKAGLGMLSFQQPYSSHQESTALRSVSVFSD